MVYTEALDKITECIPLEFVAREVGATLEQIKRTRLDPSSELYLPPPSDWRHVLANLAWEHSGVLRALARELEDEAARRSWPPGQ